MNATEAAVLSRIHVLLERRAVDRRVGAAWSQGRHDRAVELRALVAVARTGRRLARTDAITASKAYADWTESELREVFA